MNNIVMTFKALADDTRLRVLRLLGQGELCVCEMSAALGLEQPRLSFHLRILKEAGIILDRRQERWIVYRLNDSDMFIRFLLMAIGEKYSPVQAQRDLDRLDAFGHSGRPCAGADKKAKTEKAAARSLP